MYYLCGASKKCCATLTFVTYNIIALIPILLAVAMVLCWEPLDISGEIYSAYHAYEKESDANGTNYTQLEEFYPGWKGFLLEQFGGYINKEVRDLIHLEVRLVYPWVVFGFYGLTMAIAALVTWRSMRKHSPLTYLKGAKK